MKKIMVLIISFCMMMFVSCKSPQISNEKVKKNIIVCEPSTYPLVADLVENYNANSNNDVELKLVDDISNLKKEEKKNCIIVSYEDKSLKNLKNNTFGKEAIAIIVNNENKINDISSEQLSSINSGKISNWKEIGGNEGKINIMIFKGVEKFLEKQKDVVNSNSNSNVKYVNDKNSFSKNINNDKYVMGFIPMMYLDKNLKYISLNNIKLNGNNIKNGLYTMSIPIKIYYDEKNKGNSNEFLQYIKSDNGKKIIKNYCTDENS